MNSDLHFLAGLPRSGSTVLAAILNQHPQVKVSSTSGLIGVMGAIIASWEGSPTFAAAGSDKTTTIRLMRAVADSVAAESGKPVYIDKNRGWSMSPIMTTMALVNEAPPKIIAAVRHVPDCAASFVRVAKPKDVREFLRGPVLRPLMEGYLALADGYKAAPENFCIVDYDDLLKNPRQVLGLIRDFLDLDDFQFDLDAIDGSVVAEADEAAWGIKGLHDIKPKLAKQHDEDSRTVLGAQYIRFVQPEFWRGEKEEDRHPELIDVQRQANMMGDFETGKRYADILEALDPDDHRAAFNRAHHVLSAGRLKDGMALLFRGRMENIFGNPPVTPLPMWDGKARSTVLLNLEGGLGDQIHGARFARNIEARGCRVVVSCSPELGFLFRGCAGVSAVVAKRSAQDIFHDCWVPSMSAPLALDMEWKNVDGRPYIYPPGIGVRVGQRTRWGKDVRLRVGLRWQGNPRWEADQKRLFDPRPFFDSIYHPDMDFVSLQRDEGSDARPDWVESVPLETWEQTAEVIHNCDLVISSCTSVAHLAAAIGVPTWIIVPVMPYYLWALPGDRSPWYQTVTLFRQKVFGEWFETMQRIGASLREFKADADKRDFGKRRIRKRA